VECATIGHDKGGREVLTVKLNKYAAADLAKEAGRRGSFETLFCLDQIKGLKIVVDHSGGIVITYILSVDPMKAKKPRKCVSDAISIRASCQ